MHLIRIEIIDKKFALISTIEIKNALELMMGGVGGVGGGGGRGRGGRGIGGGRVGVKKKKNRIRNDWVFLSLLRNEMNLSICIQFGGLLSS